VFGAPAVDRLLGAEEAQSRRETETADGFVEERLFGSRRRRRIGAQRRLLTSMAPVET